MRYAPMRCSAHTPDRPLAQGSNTMIDMRGRWRPALAVLSAAALLMSGYAAQAHGTTLCENGIRLLPKPFRKAELALALAEELRTARAA